MLTTFALSTKKVRLQALQKLGDRLFCLSFQLTEDLSYCYIMLLINVLNLTMLCGTLRTKVRYYIAYKSNMKMA